MQLAMRFYFASDKAFGDFRIIDELHYSFNATDLSRFAMLGPLLDDVRQHREAVSRVEVDIALDLGEIQIWTGRDRALQLQGFGVDCTLVKTTAGAGGNIAVLIG